MPPIVVGFGEILWDLLPAGKQLGGAPANFAYHAGALGAKASVVSAVGNDALGREILARLDALGLDRRHVATDPGHPTGTVSVLVDAAGAPTYEIRRNVAWDFVPWSAELGDVAHSADAVCFGSLAQRSPGTRATTMTFLTETRPECLRVFDINIRKTADLPVVSSLLAMTNVFKLNHEEMPAVAKMLGLGNDEPAAARELLSRFSLKLLAVTYGDLGSHLYAPAHHSFVRAPAVKVVDTVGAGDSFAAAMVMGLLAGWSLERIHRRATELAAYVCTQPGATPAHPKDIKRDAVS
ncbi:MAG: carbohydrate kinase [Tepidisphaerales bacterium]